MNLRRLAAIVLKELRQLRRDRLTFAMIIGIPTLQLVLFGYAINMDVRNLDAAVLDQSNTARSRELVAAMGASQVLNLRYSLSSPAQLQELLRQGKINLALVLPRDFERRLEQADRPALQIVVDGSDQVVQSAARQLAAFPLPGRAHNDVNSIEVLNLYNPQRLAPVNTVPGLIGVILTMTMVMFTAIALVRERERGNMEMLITTPMSPWELTLGKVLPFVAIGLLQASLVLLLGKLLFAVPLRVHWVSCIWRYWCLSAPAWRSAYWSQPSPAVSFKPCRWHSSRFCRRYCCPVLCSRLPACRSSLNGWRNYCH